MWEKARALWGHQPSRAKSINIGKRLQCLGCQIAVTDIFVSGDQGRACLKLVAVGSPFC